MVGDKTGGLFRLAVRLMQAFSDNQADFSPLVNLLVHTYIHKLSIFPSYFVTIIITVYGMCVCFQGEYFQVRDDYLNLAR